MPDDYRARISPASIAKLRKLAARGNRSLPHEINLAISNHIRLGFTPRDSAKPHGFTPDKSALTPGQVLP